jgi:hypothetical protein
MKEKEEMFVAQCSMFICQEGTWDQFLDSFKE